MGIKTLNKWLINKNYLKIVDDFSKLKVDTLFIDGSEQLVECILRYGKEDVIPYFLLQINEIIKNFKPIDKVFFSLDGPTPAAKFQSERNSMFYQKRFEINDFVYPTEEEFKNKLQEEQEHDEGVSEALRNFFPQCINEDSIQTKEILYSSRYAPGESEHKYFEYFRDQKKSNQLKPNLNHFILSNDNDLIFLALQFIDEKFYVLKYKKEDPYSFNIIDISEIRNNLLADAHKSVQKKFDDKSIINDIIGLSFLLGNDFIPHFPDIDKGFEVFDDLLNAYYKMNTIDENSEYKYLIENDSFNVSVLKQITEIYFEDKSKKTKPITSQKSNDFHYYSNNLNRVSSFQNRSFRHYNNNYYNNHNNYNYNNHYNENRIGSYNNNENRIGSYHNNYFPHPHPHVKDNFHRTRICSFHSDFCHSYVNQHNNDKFHYSYSDANDQTSQMNTTSDCDDSDLNNDPKDMAQSILRTFNFTFLYYTYGIPSWTFYYPYKHSPQLQEAVKLMSQEGKEFFDSLLDKEITDPLLKCLITQPATKTNGIPWEIYELKIPPSSLAEKYFPLSPKAPMFDLNEIKKNYKIALENLPKEEQIYNRTEKPFSIFLKDST